MVKVPATPRGWSKDARDLWKAVHSEFRLETHHAVLLRQACELLTRADEARTKVAKDGMVYKDRFGCPKVNPLVAEERNSINTARLVLRELGLDFESGTKPEESVRIHRTKGYA